MSGFGRVLALTALSVLFASSCERPETTASQLPAAATPPQPADEADPAAFSYGASLGSPSFSPVARIESSEPFLLSVLAGPRGIAFSAESGEAPAAAFGDTEGAAGFDAASWAFAQRGSTRYRLDAGDLAAYSLAAGSREDEGSETELWRYRSDSAPTAGPLVFDDVVVIATALPSLVAVDRKTGAFAYLKPLPVLLRGPLFYLGDESAIAGRGADGALFVFGVKAASEPPPDPVEALIRPHPGALARIEKRLAERMGKPEEKPPLVFGIFGPRDGVPDQGAALFRFESSVEQRSRVYVDGASGRPALVEIFSSEGEELASNLDYIGLEPVIDFTFAAERTFFIAAAYLSASAEEPVPRGRLVVAPK